MASLGNSRNQCDHSPRRTTWTQAVKIEMSWAVKVMVSGDAAHRRCRKQFLFHFSGNTFTNFVARLIQPSTDSPEKQK